MDELDGGGLFIDLMTCYCAATCSPLHDEDNAVAHVA